MERTKIQRMDGEVKYIDDNGEWTATPETTPVSMNFWGFTPRLFDVLDKRFPEFLNTTIRENPADELFVPNVVGELLTQEQCTVRVMKSEDKWYGVTYHDDKPMVQKAFADLIAAGVYPEKLWD